MMSGKYNKIDYPYGRSDRPAAFDDRINAHIPMLERMASRYCHPNERQEVVQETVVEAMTKWHLFRQEGSFYKWLRLRFMGVCANRKRKHKTLPTGNFDKIVASRSAPARQETIVMASQAADVVGGRDGEILLQRSLGYPLEEVGAKHGISRSRVDQIEREARERLVRAVA